MQQLEAHKMATDIYQLCMGTYRANKLEVTGIRTFKSFDSKFPYQYSDYSDPVADYSDIYSKHRNTSDRLRNVKTAEDSGQGSTQNFIGRKTFVDTQSNYKWRMASVKQNQLTEISTLTINNSVTIERRSEDDILEQASFVIGEFPYKPELEQDVLDWLNVINQTGMTVL